MAFRILCFLCLCLHTGFVLNRLPLLLNLYRQNQSAHKVLLRAPSVSKMMTQASKDWFGIYYNSQMYSIASLRHAKITSNVLCETSTRHQLQMENLYTCFIIIKLERKSGWMTDNILFVTDCTRKGQTDHN